MLFDAKNILEISFTLSIFLGLVYLLIWANRRDNKGYLWFGLLCFCNASYAMFRLFQFSDFGSYNPSFLPKAVLTTLVFLLWFLYKYFYSFSKQKIGKNENQVLYLFLGSVIAVIWFTNLVLTDQPLQRVMATGENFQGVKSGPALSLLTLIVSTVLISFLVKIRKMSNFSKKEKQIMGLGFIFILLAGINDAIMVFFNLTWIRLYDVAFLPAGFFYTYVQFSRYFQLHTDLENRVRVKTKDLLDTNDKLLLEISKKTRSEGINKALFAISNAVNITKDLNELYKQIHCVLGDVIDVTNFFIAIVNEREKTLYFPYYVDTIDEDFSPVVNFDPKDSLTGFVVSNRKPLLLKREKLQELASRNGVWGPVPLIWMGVPLIVKDEIIGVIVVQSYTDPQIYNEKNLEVLISISDQMAIAIDRKRTENELQESEELLKLITEHTSAFVSIHDSNANYIFASPSHERLGYNPQDLIGQSGFTMMEEKDAGELLEHLDKARNGTISKAFLDYRVKDKNGKIHYFRGAFDAIFKPDDSLERIVCVGEDVTELRQAQAEKMEAHTEAAEIKKLALVGQVAGKMAHDFNNILGIIMGVSELSLLDCDDEKINKNLELIFDQTIRGKNLTKNLVAFAKSQEPKQEFFKISETIDMVLNLMKKDLENIGVLVDHGPRIPDLLADKGMIEHALVNFLQNSIHATGKTEDPRIIIRAYCRDKNICFEIEDNGCGIPKEHLKNIYEPSFTLKGSKDINGAYKTDIKGTGYGMANIKKYIEQHNGKIGVKSVVNSGTKFTITLPVIKKELSIDEKVEIQKETIHFEKYILLVEDEQAIADVQYRILTQDPCNHKVDIANNGQLALDLFDRNQYDFISLDYVLPGGINGMDIYSHIRKANENVPIIFISGNIEFLESIKDLMTNDPFVDHLSKPCKNIDYVNSINRLMGKIID